MSPVLQQQSTCFSVRDYMQQGEGQGPLVVSSALMTPPWSGAFLKANSPDTEQVPLKM